MPCAFVYWPHNGLLHNNGKNSDVAQIEGLIGALMYSFIVIRVGEAGHHPNGSAMQLRLIVVLPSDDVIGTLVEYVVHTIIYSHVAMVIFCVVLTAASAAVIFRDLTNVEKHLKYLSMFPAQLASLPLPPNVSYDLALAHLLTSSWIAEFDHLHQLMRKLARELSTLRSFSSSALLLAAANSHHGEGELQGVSCDAALDDVHLAKPYQMTQGNLWSVPVTTLYARIHEDFLGAGPRADPLRVFQRHGSIFSVLHRQISKIRGGTIACMYGDRIVMHFNAMDRTKHHVTAALAFISNCQTEIEFINGSESMSPPHASQQTFCHESRKEQQSTAKSRRPNIMFGVASSLARCGFLGPSQMKTFTVVSTSLAQASFMCRIAASHQSAVVATWRVAELATQQPHSRESCTVSFVSIALAVLPGEQDGGQTSVYEVRSLRTQKLLK
ncbi:transmembrane protein, putative [Bodo saltans]|uniref:Transmembrane protein, putative n=1 Tax=Bodo saltans TaxID=75058 RepID=A0A0S4IY06_BODSA|nr:transmembrane protein, putative [Bodo saltans]|eukprot:CUG13598.1 transmembrane protein, putative [Bodo saltans]